MTGPRRPIPRLAPLLLAALLPLLAGCGGILSGPPERQLYRSSPAFPALPPGLPHVGAQLLVAVPTAPAGLDTARIALSRSPVSLDYFADAEWTDRAPFLVQAALVEAFAKSAAAPSVASDSTGLRADFVIETGLRDFEAVYDSPSGPPRVVVGLTVRLVRASSRAILAQTTVHRAARAAANDLPDIVRAFDAALGGAAVDAVTWTLGNPALSRAR
jgi:cholesterol transport system auxiliary component